MVAKTNSIWIKIVIPITILLIFHTTYAQKATKTKNVYKWYNSVCDGYWATFDPKKYTYEEISNSVMLEDACNKCVLFTPSTPFELEDFDKLDLKTLEVEFQTNLDYLKKLKIVKNVNWEKKRQQKIKELKELYQQKKCEILAIDYPQALKNFHYEDKKLKKIADILCSNNENIIKAWKLLRGKEEDFSDKYNSKDRLKYAKIALINEWSFETRMYNISDIDLESIEKLFIKLEPLNEEDCD